jgi:hypothetical protein
MPQNWARSRGRGRPLIGRDVECSELGSLNEALQSAMEIAIAGLHQLCAPILDELEMLPPLSE